MRIVIRHGAVRFGLRWIQRGLMAAALGALAYCGFVLVDAWLFQRLQRSEFEQLRVDWRNAAVPLPPAPAGGLIGRLEVQRLGLSAMVIEGTGATTLRRAAGHIAGTALPGRPGNIGIAAHRDSFFRPLRNIRQNDIITLTMVDGEFRYRVVSTKIVGPYEVAVLTPGAEEVLTLVTCYPFYFVGSAPDRFIVRAERIPAKRS